MKRERTLQLERRAEAELKEQVEELQEEGTTDELQQDERVTEREVAAPREEEMEEDATPYPQTHESVDSSTVLGYMHKECGVYQRFESVRVAEIHSSNNFVDGKNFLWVAGVHNPADWATKPRQYT